MGRFYGNVTCNLITLTGILQSDPPDINRVPMIAVEVVSSGEAMIVVSPEQF